MSVSKKKTVAHKKEALKGGVIGCQYSLDGTYKQVINRNRLSIFIQAGRKHKFYIEDSADYNSLLYSSDTSDKKPYLQHTKWAMILVNAWDSKKNAPAQENAAPWGNVFTAKTPISTWGIGTRYMEGNSIEFTPEVKEDVGIWLGASYMVVLLHPETNEEMFRFFFEVVDKPKIRFAYFEQQKVDHSNALGINDGFYAYGQSVKLYMSTHLLPGRLPVFNIENETDPDKLEVEINITDVDSDKPLTEKPILREPLKNFIDSKWLQKYQGVVSVNTANVQYEFLLKIAPAWKDKIHYSDKDIYWYFVAITIRNTKTGKKYELATSKNAYKEILEISPETNGQIVSKEVAPCFAVKYQSTAEILDDFQKKKTNQIQYIGDIQYSKKEYDPCGYSQIVLQDTSDKNSKAFTIFDEDKLTTKDKLENPNDKGDKTSSTTFDIIRGDEKKELTITVEKLQNKGVLCTGVMLPKGQKHDKREHVFLMDKALTPALTADKKNYAVQADPTQKGDTDVYADANKAPNEVTSVQNLVEGEDYSFEGENKLKLKLHYWYNKTFMESKAGYAQGIADKLWLLNYFWLNDAKAQTYFIPVSTCRYPNQIARIKVFPDVEWSLNVFYNTTDPVWYGNSEPTYNIYGTESKSTRDNIEIKDVKNKGDVIALSELRAEENNGNKNTKDGQKKIATSANRFFGNMKGNFGLTAKTSFNGGEAHELSWAFAEKYRSMIKLLKTIYDTADRIAGAKDARDAADTLPPSLAGRRSMMSLSLLPPAPSVGISWKFAKGGDTIGLELAGKVKCVPFIGGELKIDLLALADKIPVYGKFITLLDLTTWLIEKISLNTLSITYRIDLTFYANLALEEAYIKWNDGKPKGSRFDTDMKFSGTFGGKLELELGLALEAKQINKFPEIDLQAGVKADCSFKITLSPNFDLENKVDITTKFSGLLVTVYYKFSMKRNSKNKPPETLDPFKLIPRYTGTPVSMKFGEGKENKY